MGKVFKDKKPNKKGWGRLFFALALDFIIVFHASGLLAASDAKPASCDGVAVNKAVVAGRMDRALALNGRCVERHRGAVAALKKNVIPEGMKMMDIVLLGYFLCNEAQIKAMSGDAAGAEKTYIEALSFASERSAIFKALGPEWTTVRDATGGFLLEKSGETDVAREYYLNNKSPYSLSRLAYLSMLELRDEDAVSFALEAGELPTAYYVRAAVEEKKGSTDKARELYAKARQLYFDAVGSGPRLAVFFSESGYIDRKVKLLEGF